MDSTRKVGALPGGAIEIDEVVARMTAHLIPGGGFAAAVAEADAHDGPCRFFVVEPTSPGTGRVYVQKLRAVAAFDAAGGGAGG